MKQLGKSKSRDVQVYLNEHYDVVAQNGIIIGSVRYAFVNGDGVWCIAITGHNGMPYYGESMHEIGSVFDLQGGEPPWTMPVAQPRPEPTICEDFLAMNALMAEPAPSVFQLCHDKENPP